jgi:long-chain acyl-CoA synthetase
LVTVSSGAEEIRVSEYSVKATFSVPEDTNLTDAVFGNASDYPDTVLFDRKVDDAWQPVTAKSFAEEVKALAAGLIAAGVGAGDRVGLMSSTRYEWTLIDYAISS